MSLGKGWLYNFIKRNPHIATIISRPIETSRIRGTQPTSTSRNLKPYKCAIGGCAGQDGRAWYILRCLQQLSSLWSGRKASNIDSIARESPWVSILECIGASCKNTRPLAIFKGKGPGVSSSSGNRASLRCTRERGDGVLYVRTAAADRARKSEVLRNGVIGLFRLALYGWPQPGHGNRCFLCLGRINCTPLGAALMPYTVAKATPALRFSLRKFVVWMAPYFNQSSPLWYKQYVINILKKCDTHISLYKYVYCIL